jgi:hypothetical protein
MPTMWMSRRPAPVWVFSLFALPILAGGLGVALSGPVSPSAPGDAAIDPCAGRLSVATREAEIAWNYFNRAAAEAGRLREGLRQSGQLVSDREKSLEKAQRGMRDAEQALADAVGALGQANTRINVLESRIVELENRIQVAEQPASGGVTIPEIDGAATEARITKARALADDYQQRLKGALKSAIAAGGPAEAVDVCKIEASEIAQSLRRESGWAIGRVSTKPRNPDNVPDAWEQQILEHFAAQRAQKIQGPLEASRMENGRLRYMRAIDTGPVCLTCHGTELSPEVQARINNAYPQDRATGYVLGDLRGAFTLELAPPEKSSTPSGGRILKR